VARTTNPLIAGMFGLGVLALAAGAGTAWAQTMPMDRDPPPKSETEGQAPPAAPGNLSDQLDRSKGVIRPPQSVDPDMQVSPPDPNSQKTPVIRPPGSPGGDPTIEPK